MKHDKEHERNEERLAALVRAADAGISQPAPALVDALRQASTELFLSSVSESGGPIAPAEIGESPAAGPVGFRSHVESPTPTSATKRRTSRMSLALRGIAAVAAAVAALAVWLGNWSSNSVSGAVPFSAVLEELRGAEPLQFRVVKEGRSAEVWVRAPGLVRWEESPERYEIAAGSRLWKVDEATNTVTECDSPWFLNADRQVDLLGLLGVDLRDASSLLQARPVERSAYDGRDCLVYRVALPTEHGRVRVEAFADATNHQLVGIVAWSADAARDAKRPLAELRLIATHVPVADDKFVVAKSLTEDGRIGKVSGSQGVVVLRPMLAKRWTPLRRDTLLKPGDWLRTELRGANAIKVTLSSEVELTLGPGTLVECISPTKARLHSGQAQVMIPKQKDAAASIAFELLAPRDGSRSFKPGDKQLVRADRDEKLVNVLQTPVWLAGFEGTTNNESLGSLIVNLPDGRNEPLTVGYHKVAVEIRDQIARTTIEESFVNHTDSRLEGVFHFPLPQDASISGFGMWIGNDLVEADVVEKQRAREIYETILREKRDPGLLEWTGGNIFKARVFPIEARSEKRIKIVYTQVLPLRANRYRYSYGLRSELLRTKPLRELSLTVTVNSALPLKSVACPTHSARTQQTAHSAQVEFAAQEYTPTRDFEVVCEIDGRQSDVIVVPHRRGDDGYLLVQLTPPTPEGNWQRELLADGKPLSIVLLCDTSASMDSEKRRQQSEFVAIVLSSLGPDDRFMLACADVGTVWASDEPMVPSADNIAKANSFLDERQSLGWTNLDRAFDDTIKKAPADAHVIYIGDGIVSAGDTDPAAFVKRLGLLRSGSRQTSGDRNSNALNSGEFSYTFHAVTVGNSYESIVMKGIASAGGGSVRTIGGEQTPPLVALELLNEIAQPGLRDLNVEFRGLKVAAVYPSRLPNVAAGTQQILVGRYLPEGKDQQGEIVVTGRRGAEKVRYAAKVNLKDAEDGNSFIPRLWARAHLDQLLAQGHSTAIHDDIIALSEEFHIITPYTSLLVLETDADRERFGVKRRYEMRDGERFFAESRDNANYELLQQQMKRAGDWRLGLRRQVLRSLMTLGRDPRAFQQQVQILDRARYLGDGTSWYRVNGGPSGGLPQSGSWANGRGHALLRDVYGYEDFSAGDLAGGLGGGGFDEDYEGMTLPSPRYLSDDVQYFTPGDVEQLSLGLRERAEGDRDGYDLGEEGIVVGEKLGALEQSIDDLGLYAPEPMAGPAQSLAMAPGFAFARGGSAMKRDGGYFASEEESVGFSRLSVRPRGGYAGRYRQPDYTSWLNSIFPPLAAAPGKPAPPAKNPETWSPEAIALAKSLLRTEALLKLEGGIELLRVTETFDPRWNRRASRNSDLALYAPSAWLTRPTDSNDHTVVEYCDAKERGVFSLAFLLGRVRASVELELKTPPLGLDDFSLSPLHESYRAYSARVEPAGENLSKLVLTVKTSTHEDHFTIDTAKHVLVKHESFNDGKSGGATSYSDFVEVAGRWWAKKSTTTDAKGRKIAETTREIEALAKEKFDERMNAELAAKPTVQFVCLPFVKLKVARQRAADGSAGFNDRLAMILHNASIQQWDELWKHVDAAEKLSPDADKPAVRWVRTVILATIRRNDEARKRLLDEARKLVAQPRHDELFLAEFVLNQAYSLSGWSEFLELVELLKPVYQRQPAELDVMPRWHERVARCYDALGRHEEALAILRARAEAAPWQLDWQIDFARRLMQAGQTDAAFAWLRKELDRPIERAGHEVESLWTAVADLYRTSARWPALLEFTTQWIARKPESQSAYLQHLSALVFNDQLDAANMLAEQWLKEARIDGKLAADERARLEAALSFANGSAYNLSFQRMDERWFEPLADTIRFFLRHKHHSDIATRGVGNQQFQQSDAADQLRGEFLRLLETDVANLTPPQINALLGWTLSGRIELKQPIAGRKQLDASEVPNELWRKIADELKPRWAESQDKADKHLLGESLRSIYATRFADTELLPFLRERIGAAHADYKASYIAALFEALLGAKWTDEIELEAFARLRDLSDAEEPVDRLAALHRLVDAMLANRQSLAEQQLGDQGEQNKLTRKELAAKKAELRKATRTAVAARLAAEAAKEQGPLAAWLKIEQTWLDVQLDQNLAQVEEQCWQILGEAPPKLEADADDDDLTDSRARQQFIDAMLKQRAFTTVMNLTTRKKAEPASIDRVLKYIDAGIALGGDAAATWRNTKFKTLVALDRPDELERELRDWIRTDVSTSPWRQMLGRLVAERGKIDEAIQLFEACEKDKLLAAADYRVLADWYLVANRREAYERSRVESFKQMPEHQLSNMLYQIRNRWYQPSLPLPSELDENTLFAFRALFEKSATPESYLHQLRDLYAACRDFRLLQMLPDAVLGRSPQQAYAFLNTLHASVLTELRNEATTDEILARVKKLRDADRTPTDLRALDLLEAVVERRSSEVLNQPGPHVDACLAALRRAFDRKWADGEPVQMASFLRQLGTLPHAKLVDEQLRELRELKTLAPPAGRDHLLITNDLANLLFSSYGRKDEAIREMEVEVRGYEQAHNGVWPHLDNAVLGSYVSLYEEVTRHAAGEAVLQKYLAKPEHDEQRKWLNDRLMALYNHALEHNGAVSIGDSRAKLFANIVALSLKELDAAPDENVRYNLVVRLATTLDIAHRHKIAGTADAVRRFAFETMPALLKRQQAQYRNTATAPMQVIAQSLRAKLALHYVVERMEQFPQRLEIQWDNSWNAFGSELAGQREQAARLKLDIRELEPRVLKLAIRELQRELRTGESRSSYIFYRHASQFWAEKAADFARAAEAVLAERKTSGRRAVAVANYLWNGLHLFPRAIEILLLAHKNGLLDESAQVQLTHWLQEQKRFAEMIPILEPLVAARPNVINYRTLLMTAYHHSQRPEQLTDLIQQMDAHFHQGGRWTEANVVAFAHGSFSCDEWDRAIGYFNEAISLHQRTNLGHGLNDAALSNLYRHVALAQSKLGHTCEAVDAASAAIVCWSARHERRRQTLELLKQVLAAGKDLDEYIRHLDAESAKTGQDSPILRKAVGQTYQSRNDHVKAIAQLQLASELQPNDAETHQALIACYDATKNASAATRQLLKLIDLKRHDLTLYQQLADRLKDNEAEAERAATSIIESSPNEAESHAAMAEVRQKQNRWDEAIPHWEQVAQLRRLEPTGLVKLAEAQLHQKQWEAARTSIEKLQKAEWPARFSDVNNQVRLLQERLPK